MFPAHFWLRRISRKILIQQIEGNVERMVAVSRGFVFLGSDDLDAIFAHQAANTPVPHAQPQFLQFFGHPWPPIAMQA